MKDLSRRIGQHSGEVNAHQYNYSSHKIANRRARVDQVSVSTLPVAHVLLLSHSPFFKR